MGPQANNSGVPLNSRFIVRSRNATDPWSEGYVFGNRQPRKESSGDVLNTTALSAPGASMGCPPWAISALWPLKPRYQVQHRGLPAAARPQQTAEAAIWDFQIYVAQHLMGLSARSMEPLANLLKSDHVCELNATTPFGSSDSPRAGYLSWTDDGSAASRIDGSNHALQFTGPDLKSATA